MSNRAFTLITGVGPGTNPSTVLVTCQYEVVDDVGSSHHVGTAQMDGIVYSDTPHDVREKVAGQVRTSYGDPAMDVVFIDSHGSVE